MSRSKRRCGPTLAASAAILFTAIAGCDRFEQEARRREMLRFSYDHAHRTCLLGVTPTGEDVPSFVVAIQDRCPPSYQATAPDKLKTEQTAFAAKLLEELLGECKSRFKESAGSPDCKITVLAHDGKVLAERQGPK